MARGGTTVERHLGPDALADAIDAAQRRGEARLVRRLCLIRNCYAGDTVTEAADRVGVAQPTGSRWVQRWNDGGVDGLRPAFGGGRPARLDDAERERLARVLERYPELTAAEVRRLVEAAFDVAYSRRHAARLRDRLGDDGSVRTGRGDGGGAGSPFAAALEELEAAADEAATASGGDGGPDRPGDGER